jgi:hypothetical protein
MNIYLCEVVTQAGSTSESFRFDSKTERTFITARSVDRAKEAAKAAFPEGVVSISHIGPA